MKTRRARVGAALAATAALAVLGTSTVYSQVPSPAAPPQGRPPATAPANPTPAVTTPAATEAQRLSEGFVQVAEAVLPAVVSIRVEARDPRHGNARGLPFPFPFGGGGGERELVQGTGSGVILRSDGVILTNNHVIEDAERITVHLRDGRSLRASVVGTDPATDLAVIRVSATGLPTARLGDSDAARVGEWVLAIGAPFGLEATVTHGVLSAKGRAGLGANQIEDYLQTDASINPGNSGGPLVNLRGEVLGINTMIIGRGSSIGFAVPARIARTVADQIVARGRVTRGWIGVGVQELTPDLASSLGLAPGAGALVSQVDPSGPSARAGLREGDVIATVNGRPVRHSHDVVREVTSMAPGARVELAVLRDGRRQQVALQAGTRPDEARARVERGGGPDGDGEGRDARGGEGFGFAVGPVPAARARSLGLPGGGVVVTGVRPGSPADRAGLERGDVIVRADRDAVRGADDVRRALADGRAALLVRRGDRQIYVPLAAP